MVAGPSFFMGIFEPVLNPHNLMRQFFKYFLSSLLILLVVAYFLTIKEGMENLGSGNGSYGILKSFEYYFFWVLPYWWLILIFTALLFGVITRVIVKLLRKN